MLALHETQVRVLLLDIEGTTTPVDFVYKTLFPYARRRLQEFLQNHWADPNIREAIQGLRTQHEAEAVSKVQPPPWVDDSHHSQLASVVAYTRWLMDQDRKYTALKLLQGKIWEEGYRSRELRGEVFPDVPPAFVRWSQHGKGIFIFSSGSIPAQKMLFATTPSGDLTQFIRAYFDTGTGSKTDPESYQRIAASIGLSGPEIVFISDTQRELDAARQAGMETASCVRSKNSKATKSGHQVIHTFDEVFP